MRCDYVDHIGSKSFKILKEKSWEEPQKKLNDLMKVL